MEIAQSYQAILLSLGLGFLVGLQREWKASEIAGIRTFPLITLLGTLSVLLGQESAGWLLAAGLLGLTIVVGIANLAKIRAGAFDYGVTTEVAVLLMFIVGAAAGAGLTGPAIVITGVAAVLLHYKDRLHRMVSAMSVGELRAVMNLALIGLIILPLLPNKTFGPYGVLNPYDIWRMVVLIVGISVVAYVAYRLLGTRVGAVLGGVFGGLISSTATTVSFARQSKSAPQLSGMAALVILIASTVVNVRVLIEVGIVAPRLLPVTLPPMAFMLMLMVGECGLLYWPVSRQTAEPPRQENPAQLKPAILFGVLYALILFIVAAAKDLFGSQALYWIAGVSGLTDVDAITLSVAKMFNEERVDAQTAWRVILLASMSNLVFKAGAVAVLGTRRLAAYIGITFGIALLGGILLLLLWPGYTLTGIGTDTAAGPTPAASSP
ncbi:MAG: hypothetical protein KatS3mg111_3789 [Pirellulaceae bacterium]|nr:MAG: hypothetical protein KatS3mg111_3789 [Pirellulaceae bacterium]